MAWVEGGEEMNYLSLLLNEALDNLNSMTYEIDQNRLYLNKAVELIDEVARRVAVTSIPTDEASKKQEESHTQVTMKSGDMALGFSPVPGIVYAGKMKQLRDGVGVMEGKRFDVTQSFYHVLLQMFPAGGSYQVSDVGKNPLYIITVEGVRRDA
jgi:hypothetical protein